MYMLIPLSLYIYIYIYKSLNLSNPSLIVTLAVLPHLAVASFRVRAIRYHRIASPEARVTVLYYNISVHNCRNPSTVLAF